MWTLRSQSNFPDVGEPPSLGIALAAAALAVRLACAWLCVLFAVPCALGAHRPAALEIIGVVLGKREVGTFDALKIKGRYWIALEPFAQSLSSKAIKKSPGQYVLETPIGSRRVSPGAIITRNGTGFIDTRYLKRQLNFSIRFDEELYALIVEPPWLGTGPPKPGGAGVPVKLPIPDAVPPSYGLASVHGDISFTVGRDADRVWQNLLQATGHAYGGVWLARYEDDLAETRKLRDFVWMKEFDPHRRLQIGHQRLAIHPLLQSHEFTGLQYVWSRKALDELPTNFHPGALLNRRGRAMRSFHGTGPVGGRAELWVNEGRVATTRIGINGNYSFKDVVLPARNSRIEIRTFDPRKPNIPVAIKREALNLSDMLLRADGLTVVAALGASGNVVEPAFGLDQRGGEAIGLAQIRYGWSADTTFEFMLQRDEDHFAALAGTIVRWDDETILSLAGAADDAGAWAYDFEVDWRRGKWRAFLSSYGRRSGFGNSKDDEWNHRLDVSYKYSERLFVGLLARAHDDERFVLPYAFWTVSDRLYLSARPDDDGRYRLDLRYRTDWDARLHASWHDSRIAVSYVQRVLADTSLIAEYLGDTDGKGDGENCFSLGLIGSKLFARPINWRFALDYDDGKFGASGYLRSELRPGMFGTLEVSRAAHVGDDDNGVVVRLGISFDYAVSNGELLPTSRLGVSTSLGGLSGSVRPAGGAKPQSLEDVAILVDGRVRARTKADGSFYVANVKKGVHALEVGEDKLPIEFALEKNTVFAEVAPGAVTPVQFKVYPEYGIAGRVTDKAGEGVSNVVLVALSSGGEVRARAVTNDFGYYRMDGLRPGSYRIATATATTMVTAKGHGADKEAAAGSPESEREGGGDADAMPPVKSSYRGRQIFRNFSITNDYLFGVDLRLPG